MNIRLFAYGGGEAVIETSAYITLGILKFGGRIYGVLGKGQVSIGPSFSLVNFKVTLQAGIFLTAFEFRAVVFITYPWIKFVKKCWKCGWFKICIWYPKLTKRTSQFGLTVFKGRQYERTIDKLY